VAERPDDESARARQRIIRRASLLTAGFFAAGLAIAVGGAALIAWLLRYAGMPFLETWLVIVAVTVVVALGGALWNARRS
jgi:FtsH-binding integral membrane protein